MPYATISDVQGEMPNFLLSASSRPTQTKAQDFLDELHVELDAVLKGMGYDLPVTEEDNPLGFAILRMMVIYGTVARVLRARNFGVDAPEANGASAAQARYSDLVKRLVDPDDPLILPDVTGRPHYVKFGEGVGEGYVRGQSLDPDVDPKVTMDMVF